MKSALLIIDLQKDFFKTELSSSKERLVQKTNELTTTARTHNVPVIWIRQEAKADGSDAPLGDRKAGSWQVITGTEGATLLDGLHVEEKDLEVVKTRYSGFYKTNLEEILQELGIQRLIVAGINTHACVRMTALEAYMPDYELILALDCIDSWDKTHHNMTIQYMSGKLSTPLHNNEIDRVLTENE